MKKIVAFTWLAALMAVSAKAQTSTVNDKPAHISFGYGFLGSVSGADFQAGTIVRGGSAKPIMAPAARPKFFRIDSDYTPAERWGGGVRFSKLDFSGSQSGTEPATSQVQMWGVDLNDRIVSSDQIARSPASYRAAAKGNIQRVSGLAIRGWTIDSGYVAVSGGITLVNIETESSQGQDRTYILYNDPPGRPRDRDAIREDYQRSSTSAMKYTGIGPEGGIEATFCPIGKVLLQGRAGIAFLKTTASADGSWHARKTGSLVSSSQGLNAPAGTNLFPPIVANFPVSVASKGNVWATELEGSVRYRVTPSVQVGVGPSWSRYSGLTGRQEWLIPANFAPEKGHWQMGKSPATLSHWSLMATVSARF